MTLLCDDGTGSGCDATHYTTDGSQPSASSPRYSAPVSLSANTTLKFFSVDKAGNAEAVQSQVFVVDTMAPTTTATPVGGLYNAPQSVVLACDDGTGSGCSATHYTTDGSEPTASSPRYSAPVSLSANTTLKFFSVDKAGNAGPVHTETYVIDAAAPTTTATPAAGTYDAVQSVTLACDDGTGGGCAATYFTTDGSEPTTGSPRYSAPLSIGTDTTLKFFSVDTAGNAESVRTAAYVIQLPVPSVSASPAGGLYRTAQSVTLSCDPGAPSATCEAIHYTTDGSTPTTSSATYSAPISVAVTTTLQFFAVNSVGKASTLHTETYRLDEAAPTTTAIPSGRAYKEAQSVTLLCEDTSGSGCTATYYTLDGSAPTRSSNTYASALSLSANTTLKFFSVDAAGNEEPVRTETYVIDTVSPTVAASPAGGAYTTGRSVTLTCTDDASGSGCASIHYTTDGSTPDTGSATYTAPLALSTDTTLKFLAVDNVGNVSTVHTEVYTFDTVAPTTSASPESGTYRTRQDVTLTCTDDSGCAGTYYTLDGTAPTTASKRYTGPISLSTDTVLKFFSVDTVGNEETPRTQSYFFNLDTTPPQTFANPSSGEYSTEQSVSLSCSDDSGGTGCADTYYTLDGSTPTTSSTRYTGVPILISGHVMLRFFSVDGVNNAETPKYELYIISTPATTSAQIATVRARPDGAISDSIDGALITYKKPATGADPAGVFLQAEKNGPAIFVAGDFDPVIQVGDHIALRATEKKTLNGMVQITKFDSWFVFLDRAPVDFLVNDVSNADLVTNLNDLDSELISVTGTVASPLAPAGSGNVSASFVTLGNSAIDPNLRLRLTNNVADALDVAQDCTLTTQAPLWRFNTQAQPSAWAVDDVTILSCPGPKVTGAVAGGSTSVTVNFDRKLDPASVLADGSQFTVNNGLGVSAATVSGRQVQLTTSEQVPGTGYTVTVASGVKDTRNSDLQTTANSATFTGAGATPAVLMITEVAPGITGTKDLVELVVVKGGTVDKFTLTQGASLVLATFPNVVVATGDVIVVHLKPTTAPADATASETASKSEFPESAYSANYDSAWDFLGTTTEIGYSQRVLRVRDATGVTQDGAPFYRSPPTGGTVTGDFYAQLQALQAEGQWLPSNCGGALCNDTSTPKAWEVSADWTGLPSTKATTVRRVSATDNNLASDWAVGPSSFGTHAP